MTILQIFVLSVWLLGNITPEVSGLFVSTRTTPNTPVIPTKTLLQATTSGSTNNGEEVTLPSVSKVAVAGATGRTGKFVVQELLDQGVNVVAMVRSLEKVKETFAMKDENNDDKNLQVRVCDLTSQNDIQHALEGCDAIIWCATGFSDAQTSIVERFKRLLGIALTPQRTIDSVGIPIVARCMLDAKTSTPNGSSSSSSSVAVNGDSKDTKVAPSALPLPKVVMLSSAGVTRPSWDEAKKEKFSGCADIPIVRLNPFGILDIKAESEAKLRESGVNYCIVRPTGLNDKWPSGARPVFSQGDVAVGRINRKDVAKVLVDVLTTPEACDKTFEVLGLVGSYPPPRSIAPALARLTTDKEGISEEQVAANYNLLQQLLPGEVQDAAALAMGQTYEQLDKGETGRLGERGKEKVQDAGLQPTNV